MWGWPLLYLVLDAVRNLEEAAYFSMETFTTLGYGHITLEKNWRLLSTFAAAKGLLMFGWSTALVFAAVQCGRRFSQRLLRLLRRGFHRALERALHRTL